MPGKIIIIGGGITGLAAAWYLQQKGADDITILESSPTCGGKINTIREDGFVVECGPDSFLTTKPRAIQLVRELGLEDSLIAPSSNEYYIIRNGKPAKPPRGLNMLVPVDAVAFSKTDFFSEEAKQQILAEKDIPVSHIGEDESLATFVTRRFGEEILRNYAEPLFSGIYGTAASDMSLMATLPLWKDYEKQFGSVTAGVLQRKATTSEKPLPMFLSLKNGMLTLVEALITQLKTSKIVTSVSATSVEKKNHSYIVQTTSGTFEGDKILFTTPAHVTVQLLGNVALDISAALKTIPFTSTAILTLAIPDKNLGDYINSTGFVIPRNERRNITACTFSSSKWPVRAPEGYALIRCFFSSASDQKLLGTSINELEQMALEDLQYFCGISEKPIKRWYQLWENGLPQYHVGHLDFLNEVRSIAREYDDIHLSGASYTGVGLPDCIRQAWEVAEEMMGG